jgi:hypothetical protein
MIQRRGSRLSIQNSVEKSRTNPQPRNKIGTESVCSLRTLYAKQLYPHSKADWDQKASATIHTKNSKGPFLTFRMGDCEGPCDQCRIASMASPPLSTLADMRNQNTKITAIRFISNPNHPIRPN